MGTEVTQSNLFWMLIAIHRNFDTPRRTLGVSCAMDGSQIPARQRAETRRMRDASSVRNVADAASVSVSLKERHRIRRRGRRTQREHKEN